MNAQITEMAKRFMVEQYGSWRIKHGDLDRDRWDESLSLVILALEFAEKERWPVGARSIPPQKWVKVDAKPKCPKCGKYVPGHASGRVKFASEICSCPP